MLPPFVHAITRYLISRFGDNLKGKKVYDVGAGLGNVIAQLAFVTGLEVVGIEKSRDLVRLGNSYLSALVAIMNSYLKQVKERTSVKVKLLHKDIFDINLHDADIIIVNNKAFDCATNDRLLEKLAEEILPGAIVIVTEDLSFMSHMRSKTRASSFFRRRPKHPALFFLGQNQSFQPMKSFLNAPIGTCRGVVAYDLFNFTLTHVKQERTGFWMTGKYGEK